MYSHSLRPLLISSCLVYLLFAIACQQQPESKRYAMTGAIVAVNADSHSVTVHNDDIPGFMSPMDMDYKVRDKVGVSSLKPGDKIKGTIVVSGQSPAHLEDVTVVKP
jgi:Cu/Ag efflux protein CusF